MLFHWINCWIVLKVWECKECRYVCVCAVCIAWLWISVWNVSPAPPTQTHLCCPKATSAEFHFTWMHAKWHFLWWKENFFETPIPVPRVYVGIRSMYVCPESHLLELKANCLKMKTFSSISCAQPINGYV